MLLLSLLLNPVIALIIILVNNITTFSVRIVKYIALSASILNLFISFVIFILFDFSTNQFQFVQEYHDISYFDFYLGIDALSVYFVLLTTIIIPIALLSNWISISENVKLYVTSILLLETLLIAVFIVLDMLLFYIFFESILPPLFILIGLFGSDDRIKAGFYLFLYTLWGSLFLLLAIIAMSCDISTTDFETLFKGNIFHTIQFIIFYGIFIAFAVKTPTIFLNTWLLKAHVESPLGGSILLAAIVLKLSVYGILRLILAPLAKAYMIYTFIIFLIGVITIVYASLSTLRTIDVKELIAYSSVSHAAVYLIAVFSNTNQGIAGSINIGIAHGLVSPGLFICAGGTLYDRAHTRLISLYRGMAQVMPLFAILFFILCMANCGVPLTLNFVGEFMSLYGVFERSTLFGVLASSSIVFSAAYTIYMYQRISFGGAYSKMISVNIEDLDKRELTLLLTLVIPTVFLGIYPAPIIDGLNYGISSLVYLYDPNLFLDIVVSQLTSDVTSGAADIRRAKLKDLDEKLDVYETMYVKLKGFLGPNRNSIDRMRDTKPTEVFYEYLEDFLIRARKDKERDQRIMLDLRNNGDISEFGYRLKYNNSEHLYGQAKEVLRRKYGYISESIDESILLLIISDVPLFSILSLIHRTYPYYFYACYGKIKKTFKKL